MGITTYRTANTRIVYDFEVMPNFFCMGGINVDTGKRYMIEISETNNQFDHLMVMVELLKFDGIMIGYNNIGFDYPILDTMIRAINAGTTDWLELCTVAYNKAEEIVEDGKKAKKNPQKHGLLRWRHRVRIPLVAQLDLFLLWHFDNKQVSLKTLEFNMRREQVKSLPIKPGTWTTREEQLDLMKYCGEDDCGATLQFLNHSLGKIDLREDYTKQYGVDFTNFSDSKMGSVFMERKLTDAGIKLSDWDDAKGKYVTKGSPRKFMPMTDIILDINNFRTPELQSLLVYLKTMTLTKTKEVFNNLPTSEMGDLANYLDPRYTKKKLKRLGKVFPERVKALHCVLNGFTFVFGTGGLHGSVENQGFVCASDEMIIDVDVTSFYPSLAIQNGWYPEHLGAEFVPIYAGMLADRKRYPKKTHYNINLALKLTLNGTYGNLINSHSFLYDPLMAMRITINGQLHLAMLAETIMLDVPGMTMIQANTDGITFKIKRSQEQQVRAIVSEWERLTKMDMEYAEYSRMWSLNVNNYIAEYSGSGKLKQKGVFEHEYEKFDLWHKNFGNRCIAKAAVAYLAHDVPIEWSLMTNLDTYDFLSTAKVTGETKIFYGDDQPIQNNTRFYYSKVGQPITKLMPPLPKKPDEWRHRPLTAKGVPTYPCNTTTNIDRSNINMEWYIEEVKKITKVKMNA